MNPAMPSRCIMSKAMLDMLCRQTSSQAATISRQPLATYQWPESRPDVLQWLELSIQHAVEKLDNAPFLELVYPSKHDTWCTIYPVDESVVDSPQVCRVLCCTQGCSRSVTMWQSTPIS